MLLLMEIDSGVSKEKNTLFLNDRGQYSSLMSAANDAREKTIRFPQLVSFIGDTSKFKRLREGEQV